MTAGKGPPLLRHPLGGSAETDPGIAPGLAGAVQGGQSGAQVRPRPSAGCEGGPPYRGRTEGPGFCQEALKIQEIRSFCWKPLLKTILGKLPESL